MLIKTESINHHIAILRPYQTDDWCYLHQLSIRYYVRKVMSCSILRYNELKSTLISLETFEIIFRKLYPSINP